MRILTSWLDLDELVEGTMNQQDVQLTMNPLLVNRLHCMLQQMTLALPVEKQHIDNLKFNVDSKLSASKNVM